MTGIEMERIGELAAAHGIVLHELSRQEASLETAFMELTETAVDFRASREATDFHASRDATEDPS